MSAAAAGIGVRFTKAVNGACKIVSIAPGVRSLLPFPMKEKKIGEAHVTPRPLQCQVISSLYTVA